MHAHRRPVEGDWVEDLEGAVFTLFMFGAPYALARHVMFGKRYRSDYTGDGASAADLVRAWIIKGQALATVRAVRDARIAGERVASQRRLGLPLRTATSGGHTLQTIQHSKRTQERVSYSVKNSRESTARGANRAGATGALAGK